MKRMVVLAVMIVSVSLQAQQYEHIDAVLRAMGLMSMEEADADEVNRLEEIIRHPIPLARKGMARLEASGLLSSYQLASLDDYMSRHGDVCSMSELAAIDGFSEQYATILSPFVYIAAGKSTESHGRSGVYTDADLKSTLKITLPRQSRWSCAMRVMTEFNDRVQFAISASRDLEAVYLYSAGFAWRHRHGQIIVGDYNARFGQGLCMWNTVSYSSVMSPSSFMKRPAGLSLSRSFSGSYAMTGLASDFALGRWKLSASLALPGIKSGHVEKLNLQPAVNLAGRFPFGQVSATHVMLVSDAARADFRLPQMKSAIDIQMCFNGVNVFAESAYDWVGSSVSLYGGVESPFGEHLTMAALIRYIPASNEHGATFSGEFDAGRHKAVFAADVIFDPRYKAGEDKKRLQFKGQCRWDWNIKDGLRTELRLTGRARTWGQSFRTDLRTDVIRDDTSWMAALRFNVLACDGVGLLAYLEGGYKDGKRLKIYLRQGVFRIDDWDDRIYVYERDAHGNFNVPAFYGRGVWTSLYVTSRPCRWLSVCLRTSYIGYPLMSENKKPGKAELKLHLSLHL